jgi:peptidoglycan-associated lipoprotein
MNRKWTAALWMMALVLVVVAVGCAPKEPPQMPEKPVVEPEAPEPVEEVSPPPAPPVEQDETPDWMTPDIMEMNKMLVERGLLGDVYFDYDKYELRPEALERLRKNADFMKEYPEFVFGLEGHCDERGTNEYNLALGERRANAAKSYLVSLGIDPSRIRTISYGEERPFCTQHDESCWSKNRRGHFVVTGKSG